MKTSILIGLFIILFCGNAIAANNYIIDNDTVYIDDSKVYLSATPHTLSSSGWVYFNLTSKVYTGNIDACWGFNTSVSKPTKAELYKPHWVNTTTNHEKTFYNPTFHVYTGNDLDYGNSYNTNYKYTITESIVNENGTTYITANAAFDSFDTDGTNYTVYWHNRHDIYYLWKDFSSSFNSIVFDYEGYDKWYYIKDVPIISNKEYAVRTWIDVPVSTGKQSGKYYFAIKPSYETISQAVDTGHFYNLDPWWNATWSHREEIILTGNTSGAQTDYQILLNVTYDSDMQSDFDDLRFCNETHELDAWLESKVDSSYALIWVEFPTTPANGVERTYYMYYGNAGASSNWDIVTMSCGFGDDFPGSSIDTNKWSVDCESVSVTGGELTVTLVATEWSPRVRGLSSFDVNYALRAKLKVLQTSGTHFFGMTSLTSCISILDTGEHMAFEPYQDGNIYTFTGSSGAETTQSQGGYDTDYHIYDMERSSNNVYFSRDGNLLETHTTHLPSGSIYPFIGARRNGGSQVCDWIFVRKYAANPPTYAWGSKSYYVNSIHYNITNQYNHTIQSDGTIMVNRSITTTDDINWTATALTDDCNLVVTEYNLSNTTVANFTLYNASLDWLKVTNLTIGVPYTLTNSTIYESHTADANGEINFTNNLIPDDYQIMAGSTIVNITCYSVYPETLFTNYTGLLLGSYIVESNFPLNYSSLAFLMGLNYTLTNDYHSYLKVPANSIASDGIYRAHHRNVTPYLSWEGNDTITEANVWKWGGGDTDSFWISKESINATHTWVNITGVASNVFPSMFYLGRLAMYESPKTGVEINKGQGVIFKFWDLESLRARDCAFWVRMFFDTQIETTPSSAVDIWYCNNSFNPAVDDPVECEYCLRLDTWSSSRWLDHEDYQPHNNVSYSKPLIYYAGDPLAICPDDINYIYLTSETQSSKSYILNATNSDPGICNLTYAQTQTMWLRDEVAGTNTPYAYTPSFFMATVRDYLEFTHHLYIANNQDTWGHSDICTVPIGISNVPPTYCRYNYFWWNGTTDYYMNGSYTQNFWINLTYGLDPDNGAPLTHVLSLYDGDDNFIAVINDSLEGNTTDVDVFFGVGGYNGMYQLKIVSTDNEGTTSTAWSQVFQLGTRLDEEIPLNLFIVLMWITFASLFYIYHVESYVAKIVTSLLTTWMSFMLSSMIVSGNVVLNYAELTTADAFTHGSTAIQIAALSHFFMFTGVVSALFMLVFAVKLVIDTYLDMQERKITIEEWDGVETQ